MSQPPQGEEPQDPRPPAPGWGPPSGPPAAGGWGPPGQYGAPYGQYGQPGPYGHPGQYGAPTAYGQYGGWDEPQPPRRRRKRRRGVWLLVLVLLVLVIVVFPSGLGGTRLRPQAVQRDVGAQYEQRERVAIELNCDETMTVEDGKSYRCDGTTADGQRVTITITMVGSDGDYIWSDR